MTTKDDEPELFKCTEHFVGGVRDPRAVWGTTKEESDWVLIALAIDPSFVLRANPDPAHKIKQDALYAVAKRVRDELVRYHRLKE